MHIIYLNIDPIMEEAVLEKLGIEKNEAKIYLSLLGMGLTSATKISSQTKIERTLVYRLLERLIDKGLVTYVTENRAKKFSAVDPENLKIQLKEKEKALEEILPKLKKMSGNSKEKVPKIEIYRGLKGVKSLVREVLVIKKDYCVFCGEHKSASMRFFFKHFMTAIEKEGIHEKVLIKEGFEISRSNNTEIRYLSKEMSLPATTAVCGSMVGIIIGTEPFIALKIESKDLADSYRNYFDLLWNVAAK